MVVPGTMESSSTPRPSKTSSTVPENANIPELWEVYSPATGTLLQFAKETGEKHSFQVRMPAGIESLSTWSHPLRLYIYDPNALGPNRGGMFYARIYPRGQEFVLASGGFR